MTVLNFFKGMKALLQSRGKNVGKVEDLRLFYDAAVFKESITKYLPKDMRIYGLFLVISSLVLLSLIYLLNRPSKNKSLKSKRLTRG